MDDATDTYPNAGITRADVERIMRAATRPGDPDQLDLFLDHLADQDRLDEVPRLTPLEAAFNREWRYV